jgi:hypothetical protein
MPPISCRAVIHNALKLVTDVKSKVIIIPKHQRNNDCWSKEKRKRFIDTILKGYPTAGILLRKKCGQMSLEDGLQRITAVSLFMDDAFPVEIILEGKKFNKKYSELPLDIQEKINAYQFSGMEYEGGTDEDAIEIFDRHQNGMPLSLGERMNAIQHLKLNGAVATATRLLLTPGQGLYDRMSGVWGKINPKTNRYKGLVNATMLVITIAFGETTRRMDDFTEIAGKKYLYKDMPYGIDDVILDKIGWLISINEEVERRNHMGTKKKTMCNKQWDMGTFNAYILWSLKTFPEERERLFNGWVAYLVAWRSEPELISKLNAAEIVGAARTWSDARWQAGYMSVFDVKVMSRPPTPPPSLPASSTEEDAEYEDDTDDEEDEDEEADL